MTKRKSTPPDMSHPYAWAWAQHDAATLAFIEVAAAHKEGRAPSPDAVALIAAAVPALLEHGDSRTRAERFGKALGLQPSGTSGAPRKNTAGDVTRERNAVGWMILRAEKLVAEGSNERAAGAQAIREASAQFHQSVRTLQAWRKKHWARCTEMIAQERERREREMAKAAEQIIPTLRKVAEQELKRIAMTERGTPRK